MLANHCIALSGFAALRPHFTMSLPLSKEIGYLPHNNRSLV
jgi:hypothetical protein